ncbi:MAG: PilC/PilY family type IV pilus protein [Halioglobus sp.]
MKAFFQVLTAILTLFALSVNSARAEDIDIFAGTTAIDATVPNVIFVLDNTSNWARDSQQWPGGLYQGQSEVRAILAAMTAQKDKLNVGVMEFTTASGSATITGAQVIHDLQFLDDAALDALTDKLTLISDNINEPDYKRSSNTQWGNLFYDVYNYLDGGNSTFGGERTLEGLADDAAYDSPYDVFQSPLTDEDACVNAFVIFIGNPNSSGPADDNAANSDALEALYEALNEPTVTADALAESNDGVPLALPNFEVYFKESEDGDKFEGVTEACYHKNFPDACTLAESQEGGMCFEKSNCSCVSINEKCSGSDYTWNVQAIEGTNEIRLLAGEDSESGRQWNLDDWAKYLKKWGIPYEAIINEGTDEEEEVTEYISIVTYTIDVFNAQPNEETSALLKSAADEGGGRYFQAKNEDELQYAIESAVQEIISENSSFAAVTLPISSVNRARVDNQLYIGMFRPTQGKLPRWFGNLKRFQLANFGIGTGTEQTPELADVNLHRAVNNNGYVAECSESFWTFDSLTYWDLEQLDVDPIGKCIFTDTSPFSDLPDGPFVEKGGVAQQMRGFTRDGGERDIYTINSGAVETLTDANKEAMGGAGVFGYLVGDAPGKIFLDDDGDEDMPDAGLRPSVHGDVVHSRPLSVRYDADTVKIFYGSNDGIYRMVDGATGAENWSFIAPEHFSKVKRLYDNTPLIKYENITEEEGYEYARKDYFMDGPTGQLIEYADDGTLSRAYIYPTQRRGGRMVYAFDVKSPTGATPAAAPQLLWQHGCDDEGSCSDGFGGIGQTWSMPITGYVSNYVDNQDPPQPKPIAIFGGGWDVCLDDDVADLPAACTAVGAKGRAIYVVDATDGTLLKTFTTAAPVVAEVGVIDINFDNFIDFAYAVDAAGNIYRIDFSDMAGSDPQTGVTGLDQDEWVKQEIASATDDQRRFFSAPTVGTLNGVVVLAVGSGDRERPLETNYPFSEDVQNRFYTMFDLPYQDVPDAPVDMDDAFLEIVDGRIDPDTEPAAFDFSTYKGWYMDLAGVGEQVANPAAIGGGKVFFNTFQPGGADTGLCTKPLGIGTGYAVGVFSPVFDPGIVIETPGIPIPPVIATVSIPDGRDRCIGDDCDEPDPIPECPGSAECETVTVCVGCLGYLPVEIIPIAPPIRTRMYYTEEMDAVQ